MNDRSVLLHVCCAPDATVPIPSLMREGWNIACFFYGNNIHPEEEYHLRLDAVRSVCDEYGVDLIAGAYSPDSWCEAVQGLENEPEGGARCARCFRVQLEAAANSAQKRYALCTTLTISPHKRASLINAIGLEVAESHGLKWIEKIWRKDDGFKRSVLESKRLGLYRQHYCGCKFSLPQTEGGVR